MRFTKISASLDKSRQTVSIPGVLKYSISQGETISKPQDMVANYLYPWIREPRQWRVKTASYGPDATHFKRTNALYGHFDVSVDEEDKR